MGKGFPGWRLACGSDFVFFAHRRSRSSLPSSPLLFMMGPMTGTSGPTPGRVVVCGKGPATGLWAESNIGGFWGPELRAAGYDGLWISGKAAGPVYLWLNGNRLEVRNAMHLWGQNTYVTQEKVKEEIGEKSVRVCVIG